MFKTYDFGARYHQACLARLEQNEDVTAKMNEWIKCAKDFLIFSGDPGNGKTFFCACLYNFFKNQGKNVKAYSEPYLMDELKMCMEIPGCPPTHRIEMIADVDYLFLDDLGSSNMTDWKKEVLFTLIDIRSANRKPTLITTNLTSREMKEIFGSRFASRLYAIRNKIIDTRHEDRRQIVYEEGT